MTRFRTALLAIVAVVTIVGPVPLRSKDRNPCAELFASPASERAMPPVKKKSEFSKEEQKQILTERPCLRHFPWLPDEFFVDEGTRKGVTTERMGEIAATIRNVCIEWMKDKNALMRRINDLTAQEQCTLGMLRSGVDPEHLALHGEFMHVFRLSRDDEAAEIVKVVEKIRKHDSLKIEAAPMDEFEDDTYWTKSTLRCMIALLDYGAKAETLQNKPGESLAVTSSLLDDWPVLRYHTKLTGDPRAPLLVLIGELWPRLAEALQVGGEYWKHTIAIEEYPAVAGLVTAGDNQILYLRGRSLHALSIPRNGRTKLLAPNEAAKALDTFILRELRDHSTEAMKAFCVLPGGSDYVITFPDGTTANVSGADYARLAKGERLPADHPLAIALGAERQNCLILYTHPLMRKTSLELTAANNLAFALQRAYPETRIYRSPLSDETAARAKRLNDWPLGRLDDLVVLVAGDSFRVPQNATVKNIEDELAAMGLRPTVFTGQKYNGRTGRTVIVISGHISEEMANFVRQLGEAGYLKDNLVVFNSCESALTEQLLTEMTTRYGAAGAFAHEKKIGINEVQQYLLDFVKKIKNKSGQDVWKLLLETLHQNGLNGVWSICREYGQALPIA